MTITPILKIGRQKWGDLQIIQVIYDGPFLCTYKVFSDMTKAKTPLAFFYDIRFSQKEISECFGAIIDNISHAPIVVLEM